MLIAADFASLYATAIFLPATAVLPVCLLQLYCLPATTVLPACLLKLYCIPLCYSCTVCLCATVALSADLLRM